MTMDGPRIFDVLVEIVDPSYVYSRGVLSAPSQEVFPVREPVCSPPLPLPPPPPPPGCCPRYGFTDEPVSFLRSYASVISIEAPFAFKAASIKPLEPATSKGLQLISKAKEKQKVHSSYEKTDLRSKNSKFFF